jgi:uncharacterized protein with ParB-like and HNH nuclease domain
MQNDNIITDEDNDILDDTEDEGKSGLYPYDPTQADIDIRESPHSIYEIMRKYKDGRLIVNPEFQRSSVVWKIEQKSRFIESVILNFPLQPFYVSETREGKYIIVDGLQRTTALNSFMENEFKLTGLEALPHLNDKSFFDLKQMSGAYQTKIEDKKIMLYVLRPSVPMEVVYDLFNRVNTGGTPLTRQEVRNCIFIGKATQLLKELATSNEFKLAVDNAIKPDRMKDREVVLRYLAFKLFDYNQDYKNDDISGFLEKAMRKINTMPEEEILILKNDFKRVMSLTYEFFGKRNFRIPFPEKTTRGKVNIAVFESVSYFFSQQTDDFLLDNKQRIIENFYTLLKNADYLDAVKQGTSYAKRVITRFDLAQKILGDVC